MFDLILKGAEIVDGTGRAPFPADVAIDSGRIVHVGTLAPSVEASETIDCSRRVVCPGFIDIHSHSDQLLLALPTADSKVTQGITTEIGGNCGVSPAPLPTDAVSAEMDRSLVDLGIPVRWRTLAEFHGHLDHGGMAVNFGSLTGHGTLRKAVVGWENRPSTADEINSMGRLLMEAIDHGSFGLSTGLIYPPGSFAHLDEIAQIMAMGAERGGIYATHMRDEGDRLEEAVDEAIAIGRRAGCSVQISHHKACGSANWGKVERTLAAIDRAVSEGVTVFADQYPYTATSTSLSVLLPEWVHDGGKEAVLRRLADPETAAVIADEIEHGPGANRHRDRWNSVVVSSVRGDQNRWAEGLALAEIADRWDVRPVDALLRILSEEQLGVGMVNFVLCEEDVRRVMRHPRVCVGSDGTCRPLAGPLARGKPHPRSFGTFPRVLGQYVREDRVLDLTEAIRKMTGLTAEILGLADRGRVAAGFFADLVVFDPATVADTATFVQPFAFARGIDHVFVNGIEVARNGAITGALPGRVVRRSMLS